jgi:nitrite reductase (NADH) small subunit
MKMNDVLTAAQWRKVCPLADIPPLGARVVNTVHGNIAVFRNDIDEVFALRDHCPHKGGPLSQGIVFGRHVACPLHNRNISLLDGKAVAPDEGCAETFPVKVEAGEVYLLTGSAC